MSDIVTKCCTKCKQDKPLTDFYGKFAKCKTCILQERKERYVPKPPKHPPVPEGYKWCPHCQQMLAATTKYFFANKSRSDGLNNLCKTCHLQYEQSRHERPKFSPPEEITCYKCGQTKPIAAFAKRVAIINGIDTMCKECRSAERKGYYYGNDNLRIKLLANCKIYRQTHVEQQRVQRRRWYQANKERHLLYRRMYGKREHVKERRRVEVRNRRALKLQAPGTHTKQDIKKQYERQKGRCYWCNNKLPKGKWQVHVDHVIPLSRGGSNGPENIVIACHTCNESKNDRLPHEWEGNNGKLW